MKKILAKLFGKQSSISNNTKNINWPPLNEFISLEGKVATQKDVDEGSAVFLLQTNDATSSKPLNISLPQYAYHFDQETNEKTPVIILQAEELHDNKTIGAYVLHSQSYMVGMLDEFELLGQNFVN